MLSLLCAAAILQTSTPEYMPTGSTIVWEMSGGNQFEVTTDPKRSPKTVAHILALVKKGFYDRQRVHRVEWWVTQWGAPESKTQPMDVKDPKTGNLIPNDAVASGGSGKDIPLFEGSKDVDYTRGVVGIASTGLQVPGDSQIFVLKRDAFRLYNSYAVLGKVTKGMDVVGRIQRGDRIIRAYVRK